jgi:hypothetical protein
MSKPSFSATLALTAGGAGGNGKTTMSVLFADYLVSRHFKATFIDCDTENAGDAKAFSHWLQGKGNTLDLRDPDDRDKLITGSANTGVQIVLADLPANSTGDLSRWLTEVATVELLREAGLNVVAICMVVPGYGGAQSAVKWIRTLGKRASYLVCLNRIHHEMKPRPTKMVFNDWFTGALPELVPGVVSPERIHVIEIPNMERHGMDALIEQGTLPSKAVEKGAAGLHLLHKQRVKTWRDAVHAQLDDTGLFAAKETKESVPA